jgi:hypothetical protein
MAERDKRSEIDKLLAEVEATLGDQPAAPRSGGGSQPAERRRRDTSPAEATGSGLVARVSTAAVAGAVAAGLVWIAFFFLPFLGATSGAAGAFLATFITLLVVRRR